MKLVFSCLVLFLTLASVPASSACPQVGRLPDFNCDGEAHIVVIGDSLVYGYGDTTNDNHGGYVLRAQARLPEASVHNFGIQGLKTREMLTNAENAFKGTGDTALAEALVKADLVVLDVGRNDRWLFGLPSAAFRNLKRARSLINKRVTERTGNAPLVVVAVMMYPNRGAQGPWMKELDALILASDNSENPADLRFDLVSKRLLSSDQIHPTPKGYKALADVFVKYVLRRYPQHVKQLRVDADGDGLYDIFESSRFGTDPTKPDTDGDGILDGDEV
jgi:lysophospholipase L1-like esterase